MEVIGADREAEGIVWRNVRDPKGNTGWVPAEYLVEACPLAAFPQALEGCRARSGKFSSRHRVVPSFRFFGRYSV